MELRNIYDEFLKFLSKILNEKDILCVASVGGDISFYPSSDCMPQNISIDYIAEATDYLYRKGYPILKIVFDKENKVLISFKYKDRVLIIVTKRGPSEIHVLGYVKSLFYARNLLKSN